MGKCVECGADAARGCELCMECSRKAVQKIFRDSPELKKAFNDAIDEMRKPDSIKKMAEQITPVIQAVAVLSEGAGADEYGAM